MRSKSIIDLEEVKSDASNQSNITKDPNATTTGSTNTSTFFQSTIPSSGSISGIPSFQSTHSLSNLDSNTKYRFLIPHLECLYKINFSTIAAERKCREKYLIRPPTKKVAIFDLDETLVFTKTTKIGNCVYYETLVRPFVEQLFMEICHTFEIWIWSASSIEYIMKVLKLIDPQRKYIINVLSNADCSVTEDSLLIKDLETLCNLPLCSTVIVDNLICSFVAQPCNGILIDSYEGKADDRELLNLLELLHLIEAESDVRILLNELQGIKQFLIDNKLKCLKTS